MRVIGLDVHRSFAEVAILENGTIQHAGRFKLEHWRVIAFGKTLKRNDEVVLEATGNTSVIVRLLTPFVRRVVVANPLQVRSIAWAKVKTDKIDAGVLAKLHASGFLPEVWIPNEDIEALRRRIVERNQLVSQMTRLKNRVHSVLHANLIPRYAGKLFSDAAELGSIPNRFPRIRGARLVAILMNTIASPSSWSHSKRTLPKTLCVTTE